MSENGKQLWIVAAWQEGTDTVPSSVLLEPTAVIAGDVKEASAVAGTKITPVPTSFDKVVIEARPFGKAQ